MTTVLPFRGLRYNPGKIKDLSKVVAPPYDILSPRDQDVYYNLHSNNIVKLDFGKEMAGDNEKTNKYTRAATLLRLWGEQGILTRDPKPGLYVVGQDYATPEGQKKSFLGVILLLKLEPYETRVVRPHEKTLSKPKSDRLNLTRATSANISQSFLLFDDAKAPGLKWLQAQAKGKASFDFKTGDNVRHRLWPVFAAARISAFQKILAKIPLYIADGHHRYETMLAYAQERARKDRKAGPRAPFNYAMVCLAPMQSPGLVVLPTHRQLFGLKGFSSEGFKARLAGLFDIKPQASLDKLRQTMDKLAAKGAPNFGLLLPGEFLHLKFKAGLDPASLVKEDRSPAFKKLEVSLLQSLVLQGILGLSLESIAAQENIFYTKSVFQAAEAVAKGRNQAAFLLNPTPIKAVRDISDAKDVMPQKSTYFLPKLLTGLVLRKIE
jgi:uncharacterized protein (DUF1015 family)